MSYDDDSEKELLNLWKQESDELERDGGKNEPRSPPPSVPLRT